MTTAKSLSTAHSVQRSSRFPCDHGHRSIHSPRVKRWHLAVVALLSSVCLGGMLPATGVSAAVDSGLAMLRQLEPGMWQIRYRDGSPVRKLCVRTGSDLLAARQVVGNCRRNILEDQADRVVVQYSCQGDGYARTSVRRESNQLVQIESQGFQSGAPFTSSAEARRIGGC